jgi:hypothetical protein
LDAEKQLKLDIISLLFVKKISLDDARLALEVSERTVLRYLKNYKAIGPAFVFHKNLGKIPHNKTPSHLILEAEKLMEGEYFDCNLTHALEKLAANHKIIINRETFREICHKKGLVKKSKRRQKPHKVRDRISQEGIMLQMDGSPHRWFGNTESCLIGAIDDANSEVYIAEFFNSETTLGCMSVLKKIIEKKGLFSILYTDKAGIFGGQKRVFFSQVKRALEELGIRIIFANSPQAKGRIERLWGTLQDRLVPELRLQKITTLDAANDFLQNHYLENEHNKKFKVIPKNIEPAWKSLSPSIDLNEIFCIKEYRQMKNDHTYSWNGQTYKITSDLKYSIQGQKIEIRTYLDESVKVFFANKEISVVQHHIQPQIELPSDLKIIAQNEDYINVRKDSHFEYQNCFYSVDSKYIGKQILVHEKENILLIYYQTKLIESHHKIVKGLRSSSTKPEHLGPWQSYLKPSSIYRSKASAIGTYCDKVIFAILQKGQGVVDNKNIWAILNLKNEYQRHSIEEACKCAFEINSCSYRSVASILNLKYKKKIAG